MHKGQANISFFWYKCVDDNPALIQRPTHQTLSAVSSLALSLSNSSQKKGKMEAKLNSGNGGKWSLGGMTALVTGGTKGIG